MKKKFILFLGFLSIGCTQTPNAPQSKEQIAKTQIEKNKTESQKAKEAYLKLQRQRNHG